MKRFLSVFLIFTFLIVGIPEFNVSADASEYIEVSSVEEFNTTVRNSPSGKYLLTSDIVLPSDYKPFSFSGELIGDDENELHTITVEIGTDDSLNGYGLFSIITGSVKIKNIHIKGSVTGSDGDGINYWGYTGGIAGVAEKLDEGAIIENCINSADISTVATNASRAQGTAGIVGRDYSTSNKAALVIKNCVNNGTIGGTGTLSLNYGGIAGLSSAHIIGCANHGYVSGYLNIGGIIGDSEGTIIENCYNTANIYTTDSYAGGIAGRVGGDASKNYPTLKISNSFNHGYIHGNAAGGILGGMYVNTDKPQRNGSAEISACYTTWGKIIRTDQVASGSFTDCYYFDNSHKDDALAGTSPLSETEFTSLSSFKNFDNNIWCVASGYPYPQLVNNPYVECYSELDYADISVDYESRFYPTDSYDVKFEEENCIAEDSKYTNLLFDDESVTVDAVWNNYYGAEFTGGSITDKPRPTLFDGRESSTSILSGDAVSAEIILNLNKSLTFNKIVISDGCRNSAIFKVYVSNDKESWTEVGSYNKRGIYYKYCYFPTQTAQYIKFDVEEITDQTGGTYLGIQWAEVEVYNVNGDDDYRLRRMINIAEETITAAASEDCYDSGRLAALSDAVDSAKTYLLGNSKTPVENEERKTKIEELHCKLLAYRTRPDSEYEKIIYNVKDSLCSENSFMTDIQIEKVANSALSIKNNLWSTMIKDGGEILWSDIDGPGDEFLVEYVNKTPPSALIMSRIYNLAEAATHKYSPLRGNDYLIGDIYYALKIINKYWVGTESKYHPIESWWRQIGFSYTYGQVCAMLYDYIEYDKLAEIAQDFADAQTQDYIFYSTTGFTQVASGMACLGAILRSEEMIRVYPEIAFDGIEVKIKPDETENGLYIDGSHIYHGGHPWIAGYGQQAVFNYIEALSMFRDTCFAPDKQELKYFAEIIATESVFPLMQGMLMPSFTNGRHMARANSDYYASAQIIVTLIDLAYEILEEPLKTETLKRIKGKIEEYDLENPDVWHSWSNGNNIYRLMEDDTIIGDDFPIIKNKAYRFMDVVSHRRNNFMMILNMHSSRTSTFEAAGGENKRPWYERAGSTLFYEENDYRHYNDDYYVSFDAKRYPGVTAISGLEYDYVETNLGYYTVNGTAMQDFVGSVSLGEYGASAYEADQFVLETKSRTPRLARKSYFMFDDEVVMMGSDITNDITTGPTETTIDQRIIDEGIKDNVKVDGTSLNTASLSDREYNNVQTIHISGRNNSEFGYYFPQASEVTISKNTYTRAGTETNDFDTDKTYTNTFATVYVNHGIAPQKSKYAYAVIPGASEEELSSYNENPDFEILMQTEECHAVYEKTLGITAVNNYGESAVTINGITVPGRVSVMVKTDGDEVALAVSDPTMKRTDSVEIILPYTASLVVSESENASINGNTAVLDFNGTYGDSLLITYKKALPESLESGITSYISTEDSYYGVNGFFILAYGAIEEYTGYDVCEYGVEIKLENGNTERIKSRFPANLNGKYGILIHGAKITKEGSYEITPYTIYVKEGESFERYGKTYTYSK